MFVSKWVFNKSKEIRLESNEGKKLNDFSQTDYVIINFNVLK